MLPLTGNIQEGVTYIRRNGSECAVSFKHDGDNLMVSQDGWFYGPIGDDEQYLITSPMTPAAYDIIGIKE